jgi:hypothetical protein
MKKGMYVKYLVPLNLAFQLDSESGMVSWPRLDANENVSKVKDDVSMWGLSSWVSSRMSLGSIIRYRDLNCNEGDVNEKQILNQSEDTMESIDIDRVSLNRTRYALRGRNIFVGPMIRVVDGGLAKYGGSELKSVGMGKKSYLFMVQVKTCTKVLYGKQSTLVEVLRENTSFMREGHDLPIPKL